MPRRNPFLDDEEDLFPGEDRQVDPDNLEASFLPSEDDRDVHPGDVESAPAAPVPAVNGVAPVKQISTAAQRYQDTLARGSKVYEREKPSLIRKLGAAAAGF